MVVEENEAAASANFERVPVVDVHNGNIDVHLPRIMADISASHFVAIDCELSGLGDRKKLKASSIDERYKNTGLVARTRSIISLGLSTFTLENVRAENKTSMTNGHSIADEEGKCWTYSVRTYNIMVLCGEDYIVEPGSLRFLVEHGFDFMKQYSLGVGYRRGNDRNDSTSEPLRSIFSHLVKSRKALVFHNGLIDLVFLYHNLYAALPDKLGTFVSDLTEMFPGGIFDTKFIADFVSRTQASFLEFVFRKEQKVNVDKFEKRRPHVKIRFPSSESVDVEWRHCRAEESRADGEVCSTYSNHGHCPAGTSCTQSHDIDQIIRSRELQKKSRKRKHCNNNGSSTHSEEIGAEKNVPLLEPDSPCATEAADGRNGHPADTNGDVPVLQKPMPPPPPANLGGHRAGFDAFMTGFAFTTFLVHQTQIPLAPASFAAGDIKAEHLVNRIYLVCKDFPMLVQKSAFAKCSGEHDNKMRRLGLIAHDTSTNVTN